MIWRPTRCILPAAVGLALLAFFRPLEAQEIRSPYRYIEERQSGGVFVGYRVPGTGRFGYGPKASATYGAIYDLEVAGPLGLEVVATVQPTSRDVVDPDLPESSRITGTADAFLTSIEGNLRIALPGRRTWNGLSPHLFGGAGIVFDSKGENGDDGRILEDDRFTFGTSFVTTLGGGVRWLPSDRVSLRVDAGFSLWQLETPPGFADPDRAFEGVEAKEWVSTPSLRAGLSLRF